MKVRRIASWLFRRGWLRLARLLASFAPAPTDRAHLLIDPTDGDLCASFTTSTMIRDCRTDGHYLCCGCGRRAPDQEGGES